VVRGRPNAAQSSLAEGASACCARDPVAPRGKPLSPNGRILAQLGKLNKPEKELTQLGVGRLADWVLRQRIDPTMTVNMRTLRDSLCTPRIKHGVNLYVDAVRRHR
jgi:hypothetical protein